MLWLEMDQICYGYNYSHKALDQPGKKTKDGKVAHSLLYLFQHNIKP